MTAVRAFMKRKRVGYAALRFGIGDQRLDEAWSLLNELKAAGRV